ncbi:unnamed protein product, partial [marine sediment metagenome]
TLDYNDVSTTTTVTARTPDPCENWHPRPVPNADDVSIYTTLRWTKGDSAVKHDMYLGDDYDDVNEATRTNDPCEVYIGELGDVNTYDPNEWPSDPNGLELDTTYYWRVDANDGSKITKGQVWHFDTGRGLPTVSSPGHEAEGIGHDSSVIWTWGPYAAGHWMYLGEDPNDVKNATPSSPSSLYRGYSDNTNFYDPNSWPPDPNGLALDS